MTTQEAVEHLSNALREDQQYYYTWQSNIAMQFKDHFHRDYLDKGVHDIANDAAKAFLDLLISIPRSSEERATEKKIKRLKRRGGG